MRLLCFFGRRFHKLLSTSHVNVLLLARCFQCLIQQVRRPWGGQGWALLCPQRSFPWASWHSTRSTQSRLTDPRAGFPTENLRSKPSIPSCAQGRWRSEGLLENLLNCSAPQFSSVSGQRKAASLCCAALALTPRQLRPWAWRGRHKLSGAESLHLTGS